MRISVCDQGAEKRTWWELKGEDEARSSWVHFALSSRRWGSVWMATFQSPATFRAGDRINLTVTDPGGGSFDWKEWNPDVAKALVCAVAVMLYPEGEVPEASELIPAFSCPLRICPEGIVIYRGGSDLSGNWVIDDEYGNNLCWVELRLCLLPSLSEWTCYVRDAPEVPVAGGARISRHIIAEGAFDWGERWDEETEKALFRGIAQQLYPGARVSFRG